MQRTGKRGERSLSIESYEQCTGFISLQILAQCFAHCRHTSNSCWADLKERKERKGKKWRQMKITRELVKCYMSKDPKELSCVFLINL
jgi:hypothetical protein